MSIDVLEEALRVNVSHRLLYLLKMMRENENISKKDFRALHFGEDVVQLSTQHIKYVTYFYFVQRLKKGDIKCQKLHRYLSLLCMLYGLTTLMRDATNCFSCGYFQSGVDYANLMQTAIKKINVELRPQIIPLIESLKISDMFL